jgi:hypothetical protein
MRRRRLLFAAGIVAGLSLAPALAAPADDAAAVDAGRALGRALVIFRVPQVCAPVVRVRTCLSDLHAFFGTTDANVRLERMPNVGPKPYDRLVAYITDGDPANIDPALGYMNATKSPETDGPREGQLKDAGIASSVIAAANGASANQMHAFLAVFDAARRAPPDDLDLLSPQDRALLVSIGGTPAARENGFIIKKDTVPAVIAASSALANQADTRFPAHASPDFRYDADTAGYLRLGVAFATIRESLNVLSLSALPDSRAFSARALARIVQLLPATSAAAATVTEGLASDDLQKRRAAVTAMTSFPNALLAAIGDRPMQQFTLGVFVAEMGYNAAADRKVNVANAFAQMLPNLPQPSELPREFAQKFIDVRACAATDFACQRLAATAFVDALSK